jgi:hypothetical protein
MALNLVQQIRPQVQLKLKWEWEVRRVYITHGAATFSNLVMAGVWRRTAQHSVAQRSTAMSQLKGHTDTRSQTRRTNADKPVSEYQEMFPQEASRFENVPTAMSVTKRNLQLWTLLETFLVSSFVSLIYKRSKHRSNALPLGLPPPKRTWNGHYKTLQMRISFAFKFAVSFRAWI